MQQFRNFIYTFYFMFYFLENAFLLEYFLKASNKDQEL